MLNLEKKLKELETSIQQISDAIYFNSGLIEKSRNDIRMHHLKGNFEEYIDTRQKLDRFTAREANLMIEKQLLLKEKVHILDLMCQMKSNEYNSEEFIRALSKLIKKFHFLRYLV
jgi:hypothetical protein